MSSISRNPAYIAGKNEFLDGNPSDAKDWETNKQKQAYWDGYTKARVRAEKFANRYKQKETPPNPVVTCAATGKPGREKTMGAYDVANNVFFVSGDVMDSFHGIND